MVSPGPRNFRCNMYSDHRLASVMLPSTTLILPPPTCDLLPTAKLLGHVHRHDEQPPSERLRVPERALRRAATHADRESFESSGQRFCPHLGARSERRRSSVSGHWIAAVFRPHLRAQEL